MMKDNWNSELKNTLEFKELGNTQDEELRLLKAKADDLYKDQFIETATEYGIARREKLLGIAPFSDDILISRRFRVAARWDNQLPYTQATLIQKLDALIGAGNYTLNISSRHLDLREYTHLQLKTQPHNDMQLASNYKNYALFIKINAGGGRMFDDVETVIRAMTPSNIVIQIDLMFNLYDVLNGYTYGELGLKTIREIKEGGM